LSRTIEPGVCGTGTYCDPDTGCEAARIDGGTDAGAGGLDAAFDAAVAPPRFDVVMGGAGADKARAVAVDEDGNIFVAGECEGPVDFGGGLRLDFAASRADAFVVSLGPDGSYRWDWVAQGPEPVVAHGVAVDSAGNVYVTGSFLGIVNFGGGIESSAVGQNRLFVVALASDGSYRWSFISGGTGSAQGLALAANDAGNTFIAGWCLGSVRLGSTHSLGGVADVCVLSLDPSGTANWSYVAGSTRGRDWATGVALDSRSRVIVSGYHAGPIDFGAGVRSHAGGQDAFAVALDTATGAHRWDWVAGGPGMDQATDVTVDAANTVFVAGAFERTIDFGGGSHSSRGGTDAFAVTLDEGAHAEDWQGGGPEDDAANAVAREMLGISVAGYFQGTGDFGSSPRTSAGDRDVFVAGTLNPTTSFWLYNAGGAGADEVTDMTPEIVVGFFEDTVDFGSGPATSAGSSDIFIIKL